jgi:hypothetical protein
MPFPILFLFFIPIYLWFFCSLGETSTVFELDFELTKVIFPINSYDPDPDNGGALFLLFGEYKGAPN